MRVRIGISETDKVVEVVVEDVDAFKKAIAGAVDEGGLAWFIDARGRTIGIPGRSVAYVEIEDPTSPKTVGFAPG